MAPVHDFRHVELDKIGRGKRIAQPPGGKCSDIFGGVPEPVLSTPRKTNNYMQSSIFGPDSPDAASSNGGSYPTTPTSAGKPLDTQNRLFGAEGEEGVDTPRKVVDRQRSSIFEDEVDTALNGKLSPTLKTELNPIIGSPVYEKSTNGENVTDGRNGANEHTNGHFNGDTPKTELTPIIGSPVYEKGTNGHINGHLNGDTNGHSVPDSPTNGASPAAFRVRNPPGGRSSGIF